MAQRNLNIKILIGLALVSEMCYLMIAAIPNLRLQIPLYLLCYALVFIFYWIAAVLFCDFKRTARSGEEGTRWIKKIRRKLAEDKISSKELITVGLVFGVIFRLTLLFSAPSLSDDIYRYIWDGKVASQGINPYHYAPNAHELEPLRDTSIYPRINHKEISTIYPPVNQLVFWGLYKFDPSVLGFKAAFLGFDILTIVVLLLILKQLKINLNQALIYVWNPLIIVEIAGSGHADIIGILLLTLALWFLITNRPLRSNFTLVLSFLTKFISILFLPFFAMRKRENKFAFILLFIVFVTLLYLPYADAGKHLFSGLFVYADKWQANSSIFSLIKSSAKSLIPERWIIKLMIEPAGMSPDPETIASRGTDLALLVSKSIVTLIFTAIFLHFLIRFKKDFKKEGDLWIFKLGLILVGLFMLLQPTVHPWYLCWIPPFLVVAPNRAWVLLTGLVGLSYWNLIVYAKAGIWQESSLIKWLEYLPFYSILFFDWLRNRLKNRTMFKAARWPTQGPRQKA